MERIYNARAAGKIVIFWVADARRRMFVVMVKETATPP
jgi:hypothetical protein